MSRIHVNQIDETSLNLRINTLANAQVTGVQSSISGIESDITHLQGDVASISGEVVILSSNFNDQSGRLDTFEGDFYNFQSSLSQISGGVNTLSGVILGVSGELSTSIDNLEFTVDSFTGDISTLSSSVSSINSNVSDLTSKVNILSGDLVDLDSNKLNKSSNLSDLAIRDSGLANLNLRQQYVWLRPSDFATGTATSAPSLSRYNPVFGTTGVGIYSRLSFETWQFNGNGVREMFCLFSLPGNWNKGRIYPKIYSMVTTGIGADVLTSGDALWRVHAEYFDNGSFISGGGCPSFNIKSIYTGDTSVTGVLSIAPSLCSGMQVSGINSGDSDFDKLIILKVQRDAADSEDNLGPTLAVNFIGLGIEYTVTGSSTRWAQDLI